MTKPKIGISMLYCLADSFDKMAVQIPKAQTRYIEIVDDGLHTLNKQRIKKLNTLGKSCDLKYTVHAPFAGINIAHPSKPLLNATMRRLKQSITNASMLDCQLWIFHPAMKTGISMFYPDKDWAGNLEAVHFLAKLASDLNVKIAIENVMEPFVMKTVEDFEKFYGEFEENIGLALDTGHANINGHAENFVTEFSGKIVHIHAHDNNGKTDQHLGIGYGTIDWKKVADQLKNTAYDRIIMIESVEHIEESMQKLKQLLA